MTSMRADLPSGKVPAMRVLLWILRARVRSACHGGIAFLRLTPEVNLIASNHLMIRKNGGEQIRLECRAIARSQMAPEPERRFKPSSGSPSRRQVGSWPTL